LFFRGFRSVAERLYCAPHVVASLANVH